MTPPQPSPSTDDVVILVAALDAAFTTRVLEASRRAVRAPVRARDGFVYQHLLDGPSSITELARRLGVSQQRASVQVADLAERGFVRVENDPADGRRRQVVLTARSRAVIEAARDERRRLAAEVEQALGPRLWGELRRALDTLAEGMGARAIVEGRRFVEDDAR